MINVFKTDSLVKKEHESNCHLMYILSPEMLKMFQAI
jgi:hypothetical protein